MIFRKWCFIIGSIIDNSCFYDTTIFCAELLQCGINPPDSNVHGANMGPTWLLSSPGGPHVDPMNLAIWAIVRKLFLFKDWHTVIENEMYPRNLCFGVWLYISQILQDYFTSPYASIQLLQCQWSIPVTLQWRHNNRDGVSTLPDSRLFTQAFIQAQINESIKLRVTGLCAANSSVPMNSPHKGPVTRKMFPFDDVIMKIWLHKLYESTKNHNITTTE